MSPFLARPAASFLFLVCGLIGATAQAPDDQPLLSGLVTSVGTDGRFEVSGRPVQVTAQTSRWLDNGAQSMQQDQSKQQTQAGLIYLGESIRVWGRVDKKTKVIQASSIHTSVPAPIEFHGAAMVDAVVVAGDDSARTVRADGYLLKLSRETKMQWDDSLRSLRDVGTNVWIEYIGVQAVDGTVAVRSAAVKKNVVGKTEDRMRANREFDPAAVKEEDKQGGFSKAFKGVDPKRFPAHQDAGMQARVERIGARVIPAYQRSLAADDPTKIHFRFQVVDGAKFKDAIALPNGIILIPYTVMMRLEDDTQVATMLADNVATVIEKQEVRSMPARTKMGAAEIAGTVGGLAVPGLGLATGITAMSVTKHMMNMAEAQSGRVSLWLLHDAGYDVREAPMTWWRLYSKADNPATDGKVPFRAANLYLALGTTWRQALAAEKP